MRKHKNSALYKAHTAKIILLVMVLVGSISMVSALTWDNIAYWAFDDGSGDATEYVLEMMLQLLVELGVLMES